MSRKFLTSVMSVLMMAACAPLPGTDTSATPRTATSPAPQTETSPAPSPAPTETTATPSVAESFSQMSQEWRVAYFVEDSMQICVIGGDGIDRSCLDLNEGNFAAGYAASGFLALSPDGTKVAYATECNIYVWTIGRDVFPLRKDKPCGIFREVKWSPDGRSIAYISEELYRGCDYCQTYFGDIFISSLDGSIHRVLTEELEGWSYRPDWSPDGKNIVFSLGRLAQESPVGYAAAEDLMVIPAEGGSAVKLTFDPGTDTRPQWSPDGSQIAFLSDRRRNEMTNLYLIDPSSGHIRLVAELGSRDHWPYRGAYFFWLPDGIHIIHDDRLINTITGQSELVDLPFGSLDGYASWAMPGQRAVVSAPDLTPVSSTSLSSNCAGDWSRLRPGSYAVVAGGEDDQPNRVREAPDTGAEITYQIYPGTIVRVVEGPVCANGLVFWKVENTSIPGGAGWTAEGDGKEYYMQPAR